MLKSGNDGDRDGDSDRLVGRLAEKAEEDGNLDLAIHTLQQGVKSFPDSGGLWNQLGLTYGSAERWAEAATSFTRDQQLGAPNWIGFALALEAVGDLEGAEQAYRSGLRDEPSDPTFW